MTGTMMRVVYVLIGFLSLLTAGLSVHAATDEPWWGGRIWDDPDRGFYWYPPAKRLEPETKAEDPKNPAPREQPKSIYEMTSSAEVNAELKRLLDTAIFNPTEQNTYEYHKAKAWVMSKAAVFTDVSRRVVWKNADIDYNAKFPAATFARFAAASDKQFKRGQAVSELSKSHGILFFYRSDCMYCREEAPVLSFIQQQGLEVMGISLDGKPLPGIPNWKLDNGMSLLVTQGKGIQTVPALFLVSKDTKEIVPIGSGALAAEEILDRIYTLTRTTPGSNF